MLTSCRGAESGSESEVGVGKTRDGEVGVDA